MIAGPGGRVPMVNRPFDLIRPPARGVAAMTARVARLVTEHEEVISSRLPCSGYLTDQLTVAAVTTPVTHLVDASK